MRHSVEEFAEELRKKFPESYNDLNDKDLVELWVKKFPEDKKNINFSQVHYQEEETSNENCNGFKKMFVLILNKNFIYILTMKWIILFIVCVVLFYTNPSLESHKVIGSKEIITVLKDAKLDGVIALFGGGEEFLIDTFKSGIHRRNYYLFSLTEMSLSIDEDSTPQVIGIGILNQVYIFPEAKQELKSQIDMLVSGAKMLFNN